MKRISTEVDPHALDEIQGDPVRGTPQTHLESCQDMKRVAIVHPWLPQYRKPFFDLLVHEAKLHNIEIEVFYGSAPPEWKDRGDTVTAPYAKEVHSTFLKVRGRTLIWKHLRPMRKDGPWDLVIVEQAVRNLETYALLRYARQRLAFWGHGRTYTEAIPRLQEWAKARLTQFGGWFFAYTVGGAEAVVHTGFNPNNVTVINNTIDTTTLIKQIDTMKPMDVSAFSASHAIPSNAFVGLFIGGLDESKRLPLLIQASDLIHEANDAFHLLVAGNGSHRGVIESAAASRPWVHLIGAVFGHDKAVALSVADFILMPGRVGLVAVDSFAAGTPIITTDWDLHAPEFEYLQDGVNAVVTSNDSQCLAHAALQLGRSPELLHNLSQGALRARSDYSMDSMVDNFIRGLNKALSPRGVTRAATSVEKTDDRYTPGN